MNAISRRGFLQASSAAGLVLCIGVPAVAGEGPTTLNDWLRIAPDGRATLYTSVQEMGQGAWCVHARILADELELPWDTVDVEQSPLDPAYAIFAPSHSTGGSASVRNMFEKLRTAGAAARTMLTEAAAARWSVPVTECTAQDGAIVHAASGRRASYGELVADAAQRPVPSKPTLKPREQWRLIGNDKAMRKDMPGKVDGSAVYAADLQLPGMLTATILQAPTFGARLKAVDHAPALAVKGVRQIVEMRDVAVNVPNWREPLRLPDAVVVVADGMWQAQKGLAALQPVWEEPADRYADTNALYAALRTASRERKDIVLPLSKRSAPDKAELIAATEAAADAALAGAARRHEAEYQMPLLAHAQMEPITAAAHVTPDGCELWAGTQAATGNQRVIGALLGIDPARVKVHTMFSGGAFGRRYKQDYTTQAAYIAKAVGRPVKLFWSREEDMRQGWYRPAAVTRMSAGMDAKGTPVGLRVDMACSNANYGAELFASDQDNRTLYDTGALCVSSPRVESAVPCGPWRSVTSTVNAFAVESFIDELAHGAGADPLAYRLQLLSQEPRARRLLETVAMRSGWGKRLPKGRGRGVAIWKSFDSYAAQVVEVEVKGSNLDIVRLTCAIDCGTAVHPDGIRAQGESAIIMALTAALSGEMNLENGRIVEGNYDAYPMLLIDQIPPMEILIVESPEAKVGGVGEPMTPPLAPALVNAIFAATGKRIGSLPLSKHGLTLA